MSNEDKSYRLTVITVVYNDVINIESTLKSVINEKSENIQFIVIDGDSSDGTLSVIEKYSSDIDLVTSERDSGIYDAMNKGIRISSGEYIMFLNSGDLYIPGSLSMILADMQNDSPDIFAYAVQIATKTNDEFILLPSLKEVRDPQRMMLPHPGIACKRTLYLKIGLFDTSYSSASDLDWLNRVMLISDIRIVANRVPIVNFLAGGKSSSVHSKLETLKIALKYKKNIISSVWFFLKSIRPSSKYGNK